MAFLILKGACGSCAAQLPFSSVRSQKAILKKKKQKNGYVKNSKRFFINTIMTKWKRSGARARDPQYQPRVNFTPMCCVYVCWQSVGDPNKTFIIFFQHEINHAPWLFLKNKKITPPGAVTSSGHARYRPLCTPDLSWTHCVPGIRIYPDIRIPRNS